MSIFLEDEGKGEPVMLAHAGVTDSRIWDLAVPALLDAGYRVIRYDLPGYGRSTAPTQPYSLVELALRLLDQTGVDSITDIGRIYAENIAGARLITIAGADHLLPLRVPEQLHPLLLEHLGR